MQGALGKQFVREFSDIIVAELKGEISSVALISKREDHPHVVVITNSDDETMLQRTRELIINVARDLGRFFGKRHQIDPSIFSLADIEYYSNFWSQSPNEERSFVALIEVLTPRRGVTTLHAFCKNSVPEVLYDDGSFEELLRIARGYV